MSNFTPPPQRGLGPQNGRWGAWVESAIQRLVQRQDNKLGNDISNAFLGTNSNLDAIRRQVTQMVAAQAILSDQVKYQAQLVTYNSLNTSEVGWPGTPDPDGTEWRSDDHSPSISFTLQEAMRVLVRIECSAEMYVSDTTTNLYQGRVSAKPIVDDVVYNAYESFVGGSYQPPSGGGALSYAGTLVTSVEVSLAAGDHVASCDYREYWSPDDLFGHQGTIENRRISVQVLGRATTV